MKLCTPRAWAWAFTVALSVMAADAGAQQMEDALHARPSLGRGAAYFRVCAACHGEDGGGTSGLTPRIGGQHASVLVQQLVGFRQGQRADLLMQHFTDRHHLASAQAIADVAAYVSRLRPQAPPGMGDGTLVAHGAAVYASLCAECHGSWGQGSGRRGVPRIAGQHYAYLLEQMQTAGGASGEGTSFSRSHIRLLAWLESDDITGIADFLSRARAPSRAAAGAR